MGKTIYTRISPKGGRWPQTVDGRKSNRNKILDWYKDSMTGRMWVSVIYVRDQRKPARMALYPKRHFDDTYEFLTFWFEKKSHAAQFVLLFGDWG